MAKVYVKRRAQPIELEYSRAIKLKKRKFGYGGMEKASEKDLVDLGVWSGSYGDISSIDLQNEQVSTKSVKNYNDKELLEFEESELKPFLNENKGLTREGEIEFLLSKGVIVIRDKENYGFAIKENKIKLFTALQNKISAWGVLRAKKEYGRKKELEQYEENYN